MACFVGAVQRKFTQRHGTRYKLFRFAAEYSLDQGAIPISAVKVDSTGGRATPAQGEPDAIRQTGEIGIATPTHLLQAIYVCSHGDCIQFGQPDRLHKLGDAAVPGVLDQIRPGGKLVRRRDGLCA